MTDKPHFFDLTPNTLTDWCVAHGLPKFRAKQIMQWVYERGVADPQHMTNLSKADRDLLAREMTFTRWQVVEEQHATDGTRKLLLESADCGVWNAELPKTDNAPQDATPHSTLRTPHFQTECVMIPATSKDSGKPRRTACISSQVGCPVGCTFCASGLGGLDANLTTGMIVEQVWQLNRMCDLRSAISDRGEDRRSDIEDRTSPITNIVFMGMGEPLSNFANVLPAIRTLAAEWAFGLSARRITLSTVGLPAQIRRLADQLGLPITLAISLHAPNDELRRELIPWAEYTRIDDLVDAGCYYFERTGREVTLEYILLRGVNDRPPHAKQLAHVAKRLRSNVNLIRYNEVSPLPYQRPLDDDVHRFQNELRTAGVNAHIRASRGRDIAAACGQLRHEAHHAKD